MSKEVWDDPQITAYVLGELPADERAKFERRLADDPQLRLAVEQATQITSEVSQVFAREPAPSLKPMHRAVVDRAIRGDLPSFEMRDPMTSEQQSKPAGGGSVKAPPWLAMAATLLLAVGVGAAVLYLRPEQQFVAMEAKPNASSSSRAIDAKQEESMRGGALLVPKGSLSVENYSAVNDMPTSDMPTSDEPTSDDSLSDKSVNEPALKLDLAENDDVSSVSSIAAMDSTPSAKPFSMRVKEESLSEQLRQESEELSAPASLGRSAKQPTPVALTPAPGLPAGEAMPMNKEALSIDYKMDGSSPDNVLARDGFSYRELRSASRGTEAKSDESLVTGLHALSISESQATQFSTLSDEGRGAGESGDRYEPITDNEFLRVNEAPLSTFSIDVDTASYSKTRQYLLEANKLPRPDAVRIEEMINYFDYAYAGPLADSEHPFAVHVEVADCPWQPEHRLARVALKGRELGEDRPRSNLVFLLDVSGSMDEPNKLPLVIRGMRMLVGQLDERDRVAIVVYAGAAGLVLDSTPADRGEKILDAIERLKAGGSTNGGQGISLAYQTARDNFIEKGTNRVILCTDGDFNVGTTGTDQLVHMVEQEGKSGIFLTVLGFGMGNHNDAMLEQISGRGNGNYAFIDTASEARKVLVHQVSSTLVTIAKDVKIQVEFNPLQVSGYRLIGYENRVLAAQDFNDDKKDAGEIGAGHEVTALYELVPAGTEIRGVAPPVDELRYQNKIETNEAANRNELMTVKLRYKQPDGDTSVLLEHPVTEEKRAFKEAGSDFRFAAAVAGFGMQLRNSPHKGDWKWPDVLSVASNAVDNDRWGLRGEFLELIQIASRLSKRSE